MIVFDTDIIIWILRNRGDIIKQSERLIEETNGYIYITPIQIAEIYAGARKEELIQIEKLLNSFKKIDINEEIGRLAGEFMNKYRKSHNVELADSLIASSCKVYGFKLWTLNKKHYPMMNDKELI
ncbi:MAG: type II toxin-antitoxin system VapC family toxin [Persephonella sp.]|nr:MAG: type II toxin-antitoxin system VapC family toxin [Persephonella sp.]